MKTENILTIIIISILVVLLLAGIIAPRFFRCIDKPLWDSAIPKMAPVESAIHVYKLNTGKLPAKLEDLVTCPAGLEDLWKGPYLKESQLFDPWGNLIIFELNAAAPHGYDLKSYGEDGKPGGDGYNEDINNK
jgi:general secretion pathway protein G